jgi:hypothetical protein
LRGARRSFADDSRAAVDALRASLEVHGTANVPARGPVLVTCNHYSRPGFGAWWISLAISAAIAGCRAPGASREIVWVMTSAWTFPDGRWRRRHLTPLTRRLFPGMADVYGFIAMPPMPPDPAEVSERAEAVLRTVRAARELARRGGIIGLAPEGMDTSGGLGRPPAGSGRFLSLIVKEGYPVLPVGLTEARCRLALSFGPTYTPHVPSDRSARDAVVSEQVMRAISDEIAKL